jgi:hypothetical protein
MIACTPPSMKVVAPIDDNVFSVSLLSATLPLGPQVSPRTSGCAITQVTGWAFVIHACATPIKAFRMTF